jgi:phage pi2 protein 07
MNNFDQSSSGINLELNCFWDTDLSRIYFDESFYIIQYSTYSQNSILVYNWNGEIKAEDFDLNHIENYSYTKADLIEWLKESFYNYELNSISNDYFNKSFSKLTKSELLEIVENNIYDCQEEYTERFTPNYQTLVSRGYCQGDYSEIIFTKELLQKMRDQLTACKAMNDQQIAEYFQYDIDHLLWDSPLYARLDIDGGEFYFDDFQKDRYTYDKDEILNYVKNNLQHDRIEYILEWLEYNLPDQPDYK